MSKESGSESSRVILGGRILRERIGRGETLWGFLLTLPDPGILELAADWDWFWVDSQHGQLSYDTLLHCVRVADLVGVPAIVRAAGHDYSQIGPILDTGAAGVMVPMLHNAGQAKAVVKAARFAPLGQRSFGGRRVIDRGGFKYSLTANQDTILLGQIESVEGLANVEQIAAVEGLDGLFFGPSDYAIDRGIPGESMSAPRMWEAVEKIAQACKSQGKVAATLMCAPETAARLVKLGYQMVAGAIDSELLRGGLAEARVNLRRAEQKT